MWLWPSLDLGARDGVTSADRPLSGCHALSIAAVKASRHAGGVEATPAGQVRKPRLGRRIAIVGSLCAVVVGVALALASWSSASPASSGCLVSHALDGCPPPGLPGYSVTFSAAVPLDRVLDVEYQITDPRLPSGITLLSVRPAVASHGLQFLGNLVQKMCANVTVTSVIESTRGWRHTSLWPSGPLEPPVPLYFAPSHRLRFAQVPPGLFPTGCPNEPG